MRQTRVARPALRRTVCRMSHRRRECRTIRSSRWPVGRAPPARPLGDWSKKPFDHESAPTSCMGETRGTRPTDQKGLIGVATLRLETQNGTRESLPPRKAKVGDRIIFTDDLVDATKAAKPMVGTRAGFCTCLQEAAVADQGLFECQTTYKLDKLAKPDQGHVTTRGSFLVPPVVGQTGKLAITGGTDAYAKARGQVTLTYAGNEQFGIVLEIEV
jgi:hypothetical protein